jgi:DNA-binding NtrC family response regulator
MEGRTMMVRRPVPPGKLGPPWWDVTFIPLRDVEGLTGILGFVHAATALAEPVVKGSLSEGVIALRQRTATRFSFDLLQSECSAMQRIETQARLAASTRVPVWIIGEAGTGKETLARVIHFNGSTRDLTFLALDCRGLQPFLLRTMLFGIAGQATTRLGTVYLKNPESLPRDLQTELLEWLEEQDAPPRIISGSRDLTGESIRAGRIVEEFQISLNVLEIRMPPLRERLADFPNLMNSFFHRDVSEGSPMPATAPEVLHSLARHNWPGNLRELADTTREAANLAKGGQIEPGHLPLYLRAGAMPPIERASKKLDDVLEEVEARMIRLALKEAKGNKSEAADALGIPRPRLLRRIETLKIEDAT